jgi:hypothetical protein
MLKIPPGGFLKKVRSECEQNLFQILPTIHHPIYLIEFIMIFIKPFPKNCSIPSGVRLFLYEKPFRGA